MITFEAIKKTNYNYEKIDHLITSYGINGKL